MDSTDQLIADAILGIDTLWGGDVMSASGTGRFIADSWFADELPTRAYSDPTAVRVRASGGVGAREPDRAAIQAYLEAVRLGEVIAAFEEEASGLVGLRGAYLQGLALAVSVMWDLAREVIGDGDPVPYERAVLASTGVLPTPSAPAERREQLAGLLARAGLASSGEAGLVGAVDAWRASRRVPNASIPTLASSTIADLDRLSERHLLPHLDARLRRVPRANIRFLPIEDAWFSGSMNYLGRARNADGSPQYEATYEINASLEISVPEFSQLVSHEVVPGHVTTFAILQDLFVRGEVGFEASVLTMNTRGATLFEGIANNAILIAHGVDSVSDLPGEDLQIGTLLALLQDEAKNQASYLTWQERWAQTDVRAVLRREYLVSEERADKLSGAWAKHPLLGRMYLPAYRSGTEEVARLRSAYPPEVILPALYGCRGLVDIVTLRSVLDGQSA